MSAETPTFLSCDWGTSQFRLALVSRDGRKMFAQSDCERGVRTFAGHPPAERTRAFHDFLQGEARRLVTGHPCPEIVIVSGMASSSIGWSELAYARTPFPLDGSGVACCEVEPLRIGGRSIAVVLVSGVCTGRDVMRGEETQLIGLAASGRLRDGVVILPGTHSKHARIENGALVDFQTFMTGELFAVLSESATLAPAGGNEFSRRDFLAGLREGRETPLSAALFRVRSRRLLENPGALGDRDFLSGILIGAELAALAEQTTEAGLMVVGSSQMQKLYGIALREFGLRGSGVRRRSERLVAAGHAAICIHGSTSAR